MSSFGALTIGLCFDHHPVVVCCLHYLSSDVVTFILAILVLHPVVSAALVSAACHGGEQYFSLGCGQKSVRTNDSLSVQSQAVNK